MKGLSWVSNGSDEVKVNVDGIGEIKVSLSENGKHYVTVGLGRDRFFPTMDRAKSAVKEILASKNLL